MGEHDDALKGLRDELEAHADLRVKAAKRGAVAGMFIEPGTIHYIPEQPTLHDRYVMAALTGLCAEFVHCIIHGEVDGEPPGHRPVPSSTVSLARAMADECLRQREAAAAPVFTPLERDMAKEHDRLVARVKALESALARHGPDRLDGRDIREREFMIADKAGREEPTDADYCDALLAIEAEDEAELEREAAAKEKP